MKKCILALLLLATPMWAQLDGFGRQQLLKYTSMNPYGRLPDGRPNIPNKYIHGLKTASSEMLWNPMRSAGFTNQWSGGWEIVHPEIKLIGRAVTAQFMPMRPDVNEIIENDNNPDKTISNNQRVINALSPGDVLVVDLFGKIEQGTFAGDNLTASIYAATGNGFVIDGAVRDLDGIHPQNVPVYVRGFHVSAIGNVMLTGINVPVRIGDTTVMPGDLVIGDREGLTFVPPHVISDVYSQAKITELHDIWTKGKFATGKYKSSQLYPRPKDPALIKEYEDWLAGKKKDLGIE
jgi:regulator of RNase E activity RraA